MFSLAAKLALVTGAGSGIGAAIAETFARAGAELIVTDRDVATRAGDRRSHRRGGRPARAVALDVTDEDACQRVAAEVHARRAGSTCS